MLDTYLFRGLRPVERRLIYISGVGILICLYILLYFNFSDFRNSQLEKEIGVLAETESDIRIKNYAQTLWQSARKDQKVREGDKVYTGNRSFATVRLKNESRIELKENSLVEFKKLNNENIADLAEGEYRVAIVKDLRVAIRGQMARIEGNSEIILKVDKNKNVTVETLQGAPTIQYQAKTYNPTKEATTPLTFDAPEPLPEVSDTKPVSVNTDSKTYDYYLKLYDVYDRIGQNLKIKNAKNQIVRLTVPLGVETFDSSSEIFVEYSANSDLSNPRQYSLDALDRSLPQVFLGDNYWRASQNNKEWSSTAHFFVRTLLLPTSKIEAQVSRQQLFMKSGQAEVDVVLKTTTNANGYLVESSRSPIFDQNAITHWSYENSLHLRFVKTGVYYYRFRAVDEDLRLGEWSDTARFEVVDPPALDAPRFARQEYTATTGENLILSWNESESAKNYKVKIYNTTEEKIVEEVVTNPFLRWKPQNAGNYYAEVRSLDSYNRISEPGKASIAVKAIQVRISNVENDKKEESNLIEEAEEEREVASEEPEQNLEVITQYQTVKLGLNADFVLSRFTFSTNYYDGFNSKALTDADILPVATPGLQATGLMWKDHHGLEGLLQKNLTSNEPGAADFYTLEARYHFRFYNSSRPPGDVGFHVSPFIGYELYSNSNSTNFLSDYKMLKLGMFLEMPLMSRWTLGFTAAYGTGDSLTKYEALMDVSYFFKKQWALGAGLKTSVLFGATPEFPLYPEYREGYSLGQFNLRYFF